MGKSHEAIEQFFIKKGVKASKCRTETSDKIDTSIALNNLSLVCMLTKFRLFAYGSVS
jgi:hypothetical protein